MSVVMPPPIARTSAPRDASASRRRSVTHTAVSMVLRSSEVFRPITAFTPSSAAATSAATCATFSSWIIKISFSPASFAATSARASPRIMTTSLLIVRKDSEKSAISSLANNLLQIRVVFVKGSVAHPVNFKLVGVERLFNGQRIGFHGPVVGVPEIEPVFALEAGNSGL